VRSSCAIDRLLHIEPADQRRCILLDRAVGCNRSHQRPELAALLLEIDFRSVLVDRRLRHAIEGIRHEDRVPRRRQTLRHVAHRRSEAEGVGPDDHARVCAGGRMNESGVAGAIGRLDVGVRLSPVELTTRSPQP
jgi:hypothetical protein